MADTYAVERSTTIDAPPSAVYERLIDFRRWRAWSPFEDLDPDMERTYTGADAGEGAAYEWSGSLKAGAGRLDLVRAVPDEQVVVEQRNRKPMRSESTSTFALLPAGDGTRVTWTMAGPTTRVTRLMARVRSMDAMIGPLFERGLERLKADAERASGSA